MDGEKIVSLARVKHLIENEEKERELSQVQRSALDHATAFSHIKLETSEKLIEGLKELEHVSEASAVKIADLLPTSSDEIGAIFAKERFNLSKEEIEAILDIVRSME